MGPLKLPDRIQTGSVTETRKAGKTLSALLSTGDVVSLEGELGSGKTQFVKGIAEGMDMDPEKTVFSPTYTIINIYEGRERLYHVDLYRLSADFDELAETGFFEVVGGDGIALIEWGDRAINYLPLNSFRVILSILDENRRQITLLRGLNPDG